jgi:hypothetical protein
VEFDIGTPLGYRNINSEKGKDRRRAMTGIAADRFTIDASRCIANLRP